MGKVKNISLSLLLGLALSGCGSGQSSAGSAPGVSSTKADTSAVQYQEVQRPDFSEFAKNVLEAGDYENGKFGCATDAVLALNRYLPEISGQNIGFNVFKVKGNNGEKRCKPKFYSNTEFVKPIGEYSLIEHNPTGEKIIFRYTPEDLVKIPELEGYADNFLNSPLSRGKLRSVLSGKKYKGSNLQLDLTSALESLYDQMPQNQQPKLATNYSN